MVDFLSRKSKGTEAVTKSIEEKLFIVDMVIVHCAQGCGSERSIPINPPFRSAEEFIKWQKMPGSIPPCSCGCPVADLKLRMADEN
jgi:hypothetical protein